MFCIIRKKEPIFGESRSKWSFLNVVNKYVTCAIICRHQKEYSNMKNKLRMTLAILFVSIFTLTTFSETEAMNNNSIQIRLRVEDRIISATLNNSKTSRDFMSLLPLTLTLTDYGETEKISDLPKELSTEGAPSGSDPSAGDIAYYAPWGNLAIFRKDFRYSKGLVIMGNINSGLEILHKPGPVRVTIERIN